MPDPTAGRVRRAGQTAAFALLLSTAAAWAAPPPAPAANPAKPSGPAASPQAPAVPVPGTRIVAVVNGEAITNSDVENRARLFALSTGLPLSNDVVARLRPQVRRQLIDERLRMQEAQRQKIVIQDQQIADAIKEIEQRNGMAPGTLRRKLEADGVGMRTLIDQVRTQLGWTQVMRNNLSDKLAISDTEIDAQLHAQAQLTGKPEFRIGEIFLSVDDPASTAETQRFAETVIKELRAGAPFALVAAQFSQNQNALEGGELGWVQLNQLDPAVARLATEMPVGAISNPVKVPGGFSIVTLQGRREVGRDMATVLTLRQASLPFTSILNPEAPTDQQRQALERAKQISASTHGCDQMEKVAASLGGNRPADPGDVRLENVNPPQFRQLLANLPIGTASQPLVARDGISVIMVCSREQKNMAVASRDDIRRQLINERVEMFSRQMQRDLRRQSVIEIRDGNA